MLPDETTDIATDEEIDAAKQAAEDAWDKADAAIDRVDKLGEDETDEKK